MGSYFVVVGITPIACANSIAWYCKSKPENPIRDVYFITSWDQPSIPSPKSQEYVNSVVDLTTANLERMQPDIIENIEFHPDDIIWLPEENLIEGVSCVTEGIHHRTRENEEVTIDTTAGRKTMAASAMLSGYILNNSYSRKVTLAYYWLRRFDTEIMGKPAYDLDIKDAKTILTDVDELNDAISMIHKKHRA